MSYWRTSGIESNLFSRLSRSNYRLMAVKLLTGIFILKRYHVQNHLYFQKKRNLKGLKFFLMEILFYILQQQDQVAIFIQKISLTILSSDLNSCLLLELITD